MTSRPEYPQDVILRFPYPDTDTDTDTDKSDTDTFFSDSINWIVMSWLKFMIGKLIFFFTKITGSKNKWLVPSRVELAHEYWLQTPRI